VNDEKKYMMRDIFIENIFNRMSIDDKIFFVCADFGAPKLDDLRNKFKDRFINVGIAEQNLINVSTGLALEGFTVYCYAIAPFLTMRAYEQIRINISLHAQVKELNINLIGVGAGLSYDVTGPTHHCLEDISIMRTLPNINLYSPCDWYTVNELFETSINLKKPKYFRLDAKSLPQLHNVINKEDFENGYIELFSGNETCIISTGYMTHKAIKAVKILNDQNFSVGLIDMITLKPVNEKLLAGILSKYKHIVTIEEAFINKGGLDSIFLNVINNNGLQVKLKAMGFEDKYDFEMGDRDLLLKNNNLDIINIIEQVKKNR
jgi:transketolase